MDDCLFCKIVAGDIPGEIVHTTEHSVAFRDINGQAPLHVLVVPRAHYANAAELAAGDPAASAELIRSAHAVAVAAGYDD
uniref:HIT domain-containing protein n=1 Tax=Nocardioides sp. TaxID=35761 RepID=UPI002B270993